MAVKTKNFGSTKEGKAATLYTMTNVNGVVAEVTDYGAILVNLLVPDKNGNVVDVVLGYDKVDGYLENGCYFGATVGPSANRIDNASFEIDSVKYDVPVNDGTNNLHSDYDNGYHKRLWNASTGENCVVFTLEDADGTSGFPGNKKVQVTYTLTDDNEVKIDYHVTSDKNTLVNMTNHSYFNLAGHNAGSIESHKLQILASKYTPVHSHLIPTGEIADVAGTPFDFTIMKVIGNEIDADNEQLKFAQGYDHNWCVDNCDGSVKKIATVEEPVSGRIMEVYTDLPGVQFYAGNCITPHTGKAGAGYGKRTGLCLETQTYPDSINKAGFPDVIHGPGKDYKTTTIYKFI